MKTQDWRAANAPKGPGLVVRCACGNPIVRLSPSQTITRDQSVAFRPLHCKKCGETTNARIIDDGSSKP